MESRKFYFYLSFVKKLQISFVVIFLLNLNLWDGDIMLNKLEYLGRRHMLNYF